MFLDYDISVLFLYSFLIRQRNRGNGTLNVGRELYFFFFYALALTARRWKYGLWNVHVYDHKVVVGRYRCVDTIDNLGFR